jgi:hypothetical protein
MRNVLSRVGRRIRLEGEAMSVMRPRLCLVVVHVPVPVPVCVDFGLRSVRLLLLRSALRVLLVKHVLMLFRARAL